MFCKIRLLAVFIAIFTYCGELSAEPITPIYQAPWAPEGATVPLSVTNASSNVQLGWATEMPQPKYYPTTALVCNTGSIIAYVNVGGSAVVATTTNFPVQPGACPALALNGATYIAAITSASTTTLSITAGNGSTLGTNTTINNVGLNAGANLIGATMTFKRYDATPGVQAAQYVSGNDIGGLVAFTLDRTASGLLQSVGLQFVGGAATAINATCFDANPTASTFTDKSTFTIAAADEAKRINKSLFSLTPVAQTGDSVTAASVDNYAQPFNSTPTIWCAFVSTGTFTPASITDMRANIKIGQSAQ